MKTNRLRIIIIVTLLGLVLSGCDGLLAQPTATPTATNTPQPTATVVNTATPTIMPTPINMPSEGYFDSGIYQVPLGGYSFAMPTGNDIWHDFVVDIDFSATSIKNEYGNFWLRISDIQHDADFTLADQIQSIEDQISSLSPELTVINNDEAWWVNGHEIMQIIFYYESESAEGMIDWLVLDAGNGRFFSFDIEIYARNLRSDIFEAYVDIRDQILNDFQVFDPIYVSPAECQISEDPTYGYSENNPILLGGGSLQAIDRKMEYLNNLLGPNQELVMATRLRSFMVENLLVEEYELTYVGLDEPVIIYLNTGVWSPIAAPIGFICKQPFPQDEP
ncbi:hypothetical protein JR338_06940 [Chloroflexota bacterium]|nr:hypothetical protein JR338_06940 [Chloroflexota bacterium]